MAPLSHVDRTARRSRIDVLLDQRIPHQHADGLEHGAGYPNEIPRSQKGESMRWIVLGALVASLAALALRPDTPAASEEEMVIGCAFLLHSPNSARHH